MGAAPQAMGSDGVAILPGCPDAQRVPLPVSQELFLMLCHPITSADRLGLAELAKEASTTLRSLTTKWGLFWELRNKAYLCRTIELAMFIGSAGMEDAADQRIPER